MTESRAVALRPRAGFVPPRMLGLVQSAEMVARAGVEGQDTLIVGLTFRCNSRCRFCIIEHEIDARLADTDHELIERVCEENARTGAFRRLVLTGAEVTLLPQLTDLARLATSTGGFSHVRIQTNGRKLEDEALVERLIDAGVTEYFVSIHAHEPQLDARMTRAPQSFPAMRVGIANLLRHRARVISNTVVTTDNYRVLPEVARFLVGEGIREAHFWNFLEIGAAGQSDQFAPLRDAMPKLVDAVDLLRQAGVEVVIKWFPRCLLGAHAPLLDNHQPPMLIRDEFQHRMGRNFGFGCAYANSCRHFGNGCDGLHERYASVMGDERDLLRPEPALA